MVKENLITTKFYLVALCFCLSSCGVFSKYGMLSKYPNLLGDEYELLLTDENLKQLASRNETYLFYSHEQPDFLKNGTVRVLSTTEKSVYNFIEVGNWLTNWTYDVGTSKTISGKSEMHYDSLGNM